MMFNYEKAFSRNIGWLTEDEQRILRTKRIAIAGMGGVGGFHLLTLARLGIEKFNIADFDVFEKLAAPMPSGATVTVTSRLSPGVPAARLIYFVLRTQK